MKRQPIALLTAMLMLAVIFFLTGFNAGRKTEAVQPQKLKCERLTDPTGIDVINPALSWITVSGLRSQSQSAYQVLVASSPEKLASEQGDLWDSKKVNSHKSIQVIYDGKPLTSGMACYWKVKVWDKKGKESGWSAPARWSMGLLSASDWKGQWIGLDKAVGNDKVGIENTRLSARMLRKEFESVKSIKKATAYICGLGLVELYLNGEKIGDQVLAPALSEYNKRAYYLTFDITGQVKSGKNSVGILLGNGRYFAPRVNVPIGTTNYGFPKVKFQLTIDYTDGTRKEILSDNSWRLTTNGPITANNEYDGEEYDATKEINGWDLPGFDDSGWEPANVVEAGAPVLSAQMSEPIKVMETLKPVSVKEVSPGVFIFDMGQNMVGWEVLRVKGPRGTAVTLRFAETLQPDGNIYLANIRSANVSDTYRLKGESVERYEPRFTYHGFRYVEMRGFPGKPDLSALEGRVVYDSMASTGSFSTSNEMVNAIYKNAYWGIRGNYRSLPTDCPQRDERQGWLGDRATGSKGESFLFDNAGLYAKWLQDIEDAQREDGSIPDVAPSYWKIYSDNVTWPGAYLIIANMLYDQYGNPDPIRKHYNSMRKWIIYMKDKYLKEGILVKDTYGDWCMPPENPLLIHSKDPARKTNGEILSTTYFYGMLSLMERFSGILSKTEDAAEYNSLAAKVKEAYNKKYFREETGQYGNNTATANLLSLAYGLVPENYKDQVFQNIVTKTMGEFKGHISTGLVGAQWINRVLTQYGRPDIAYQLVTNTDYPSWGYMVKNGATTIWELWNGNTADPAMNSGNHVMLLGDLVIWFYENLAGIKSNSDQPGFKQILMNPVIPGDLKFVDASYESTYGTIKSNWDIRSGKFVWKISIPANTSALVYVPANKEEEVKEGGSKASLAEGVKFLRLEKGKAVYEVGSGNYQFVSGNTSGR